jgi:hypothetical protein
MKKEKMRLEGKEPISQEEAIKLRRKHIDLEM